jgi:hypothetical protein
LHTYYISVVGFRLLRTVDIQGENSSDTYYADYREVDGIMTAFYSREIPHQTGQAQEMTVTHYVSNPAIDPALFEPPEQSTRDYEFTAGDAAEDLPLRFIENHLFIPVVVDGKERLWVLDTGAGMSVIDKAFADELGLVLEGDLKGVGAGGTVDVTFATLPPFELKGIRFDEQTVATLDGEHSGVWLFDLGAGMTHLDGCYALREGYTERAGVLRMGHGAGNEYQLKAVKGDSMVFAGFTVREPDIRFAYGATDTVFTADRIGILGNSLFRNFVLYVDYGNERVILEKGERFNKPWPEDHSGLNVGWTAGTAWKSHTSLRAHPPKMRGSSTATY